MRRLHLKVVLPQPTTDVERNRWHSYPRKSTCEVIWGLVPLEHGEDEIQGREVEDGLKEVVRISRSDRCVRQRQACLQGPRWLIYLVPKKCFLPNWSNAGQASPPRATLLVPL